MPAKRPENVAYVAFEDLSERFTWRECNGPSCDRGVICRKGCQGDNICASCNGVGWINMGHKVDLSYG